MTFKFECSNEKYVKKRSLINDTVLNFDCMLLVNCLLVNLQVYCATKVYNTCR